MRIFVTGASGFIGRRIVAQLRKNRHSVYILKARLNNRRAVEQELRKAKPDCIVHLAWEGLPDIGSSMSAKNKQHGKLVCSLARTCRVPKLVMVGSAWEYENKKEQITHRHQAFVNAKNAIHTYGESLMRKQQGVFIWAIPFFVYGEGKKSTTLIPTLITQGKKGETVLPNNPDAWHDFIYVDDVARALCLLATEKVSPGVYDIGTGKLTRTGSIAQEIARQLNLPVPRLKKIPARGQVANIRPLTKSLGWEAKTSLKEGIAKIIRHAN